MTYLDKALRYGLLAVAFSLPFVRLYHISEYLFISLLILWLGRKLFTEPVVFEKTSLDIPILVFLGWIFVTIPFATDWIYSLEEWRKSIPRFLIFWFVVNVVKTEHEVRAILHSFSLGFVLVIIVETVHFFARGGDFLSMNIRAGDLTGSSQWFSNSLVMGFPLLWLGFFRSSRTIVRGAYSLALVLTVGALFLVHTRAAWVAVLAQISAYLYWKSTKNWFFSGMVAFLIVGLLLTALMLPGKHLQFLSKSEFTNPETMFVRFNTWKLAIDDIIENPITGIGYGKRSFGIKHPDLEKGYHNSIHNSFLAHAVQLGIPGILLLCWVLWRVLKHLTRQVEVEVGNYQGTLALALFLMTIGLMVRNLFDDMLGGAIVYIFWLLVGLSFVLTPTRTSYRFDHLWKIRCI